MTYSWYTNKSDIKSPDTIHQILAFGTLSDIRGLKETLGEIRIQKLFLKYPKKIYTPPTFNFVKNYVLKIASLVDEQKYLKSEPRHIR